MRVAHVLRDLPGGTRQLTENVVRALETQGVESVLVDPVDSGRDPRSSDAPRSGWLRVDSRQLVGCLKSSGVDCAVVHGEIPAFDRFGLSQTIPTAYWAHTYDAFCPAGSRYFRFGNTACTLVGVPDGRCIVNAYVRGCNTRRPLRLGRSYRASKRTGDWLKTLPLAITCTEYVAQFLREQGVDAGRILTLPSVFGGPFGPDPAASASAPGDGSQGGYLLWVGRVVREKGLRDLISVLPALASGWPLVVVGDGPDLAQCQALATRLGVGDRVRFLGHRSGPELAGIYAAASVLVVSSRWPEPFGLIGPEAMSFGIPVVATDTGGVRDWLLPGVTGLLVPPADSTAMASAIDRLSSDRALLALLGRQAHTHWLQQHDAATAATTIATRLAGIL
jgi:glycosyltransferase involved in cell wall biosynthesis